MKDFDHPNVLNALGVGFNTDNRLPFVMLPFMVNGDLKTYLKRKHWKTATVDYLSEVHKKQYGSNNCLLCSYFCCTIIEI